MESITITEINYVICTHNDIDGFCCGAILLNQFPEAKVFFATSNSLYKVLYRIRHALKSNKNGKKVKNHLFICDISLNGKLVNQINKALQYIRIKKKFDLELTWIDHHKWPPEEYLIENFEKIVDSTKRTAACLVQEYINSRQYNDFVELAEGKNSKREFIYWKRVIRNVCKTNLSGNKQELILIAFSKFVTNKMTDEFNFVIKELINEDLNKIKTFVTLHGKKFGVLDLREISYKINLYKAVFRVSNKFNCDFICVIFENGEISCYNTTSVCFNFLKDYGAVGHLEKGAVHIPTPCMKSGIYGFKRLISINEFIEILRNKL
ncbi:MAG: hypothetical protein ACTSR3_12905 [Candidatus Helarchaeota archaeon]